MKSLTMAGTGWMATTVAVLLMAGASPSHGASLNTKSEVKCFGALNKASSKQLSAVAKAMATCRDSVIAGDIAGPCPDTTAQAAIDQAAEKNAKAVVAKCKSTCTGSGLDCIDNLFCPPNGNAPGNCTAAGKNIFHAVSGMGFPGTFCDEIIGSPLDDGAGLATCMAGLGENIADKIVDMVYGDVNQMSGLSTDATKCLSKVIKAMPKSAGKMAGAVAKCRNTSQGTDVGPGDPPVLPPDTCATADPKTASLLDKTKNSLGTLIEKSCTPAAILELDLCGNGPGGTPDVASAKTCLTDVLVEASYTIENVEDRDYLDISLINAVYPSTLPARCGDNIVNQLPSQFSPIGEECDGTDDSACPGLCFPPGDVFECSCPNTKRARSFAVGATADLDNGWSGASHNSAVTQGAGFVTTMENCDCTAFGGVQAPTDGSASPVGNSATCTGVSGDPICDLHGFEGPRCSYNPHDTLTCNQRGNNDDTTDDDDCAVCDSNSTNPGVYCSDEGDCGSQCFDNTTDLPVGLCERQSDCAEGQTCKGRCDNETYYCLNLRNGAPLPLSAQGTSVCVDVKFADDVSGTRNIVTGEHAVNFNELSVTYLAQSLSRPCPICGGFCTAPGALVGEPCEGTCSGPSLACRGGTNAGGACTEMTEAVDCPGSQCEGLPCRFDSDCSMGETCDAVSPECHGEICQLALICAGGKNDGRSCRVEATTAFGTTSADCPPPTSGNISGVGLKISFTPLTSEPQILERPGPCDTPGLQNYDCNCTWQTRTDLFEAPGTTRTQPNRCAPACTAPGPGFGLGCGGNYTTCVGGGTPGVVCDQNTDCGVGTCTGNPKVCDAGANVDQACTSDPECPGGLCVDACPGGICYPVCVQKGECTGGANAGKNCGIEADCPGGTCTITDPEEGVCAAGPPLYHCGGIGQEFRTCLPEHVNTQSECEAGIDNTLCDPDGPDNILCDPMGPPNGPGCADDGFACSDDNIGAGYCIADVRNCFYNQGAAEGGDIFNGKGDATNTSSVTVFCIPASSSDSVNVTAGLPGPGRLRQKGVVVPNFTTLP